MNPTLGIDPWGLSLTLTTEGEVSFLNFSYGGQAGFYLDGDGWGFTGSYSGNICMTTAGPGGYSAKADWLTVGLGSGDTTPGWQPPSNGGGIMVGPVGLGVDDTGGASVSIGEGYGVNYSKTVTWNSIKFLYPYNAIEQGCQDLCDSIDDESRQSTGHNFFPHSPSDWLNGLGSGPMHAW